mgnify:CR=1 FL=1
MEELAGGHEHGRDEGEQESEQDEDETVPIARWERCEAFVWLENDQADEDEQSAYRRQ